MKSTHLPHQEQKEEVYMDNGRTDQNGNVIVINDLTKQFDDITAVDGYARVTKSG